MHIYLGEEDIIQYIPNDHSRQVNALKVVERIYEHVKNTKNVLDLGCGIGNSYYYFKNRIPNIEWIGVDIESSPEVKLRTEHNEKIIVFDGINIPLRDSTTELVYSNQVFEHVKKPEALIMDIYRILRPGGYFVGSVSNLEPYHSLSMRNYTPYGFKELVESSGLTLEEIRPGIDALTLIIRRIMGSPKILNRYWNVESPLNRMINIYGSIRRMTHREINLLKLLFCGQFSFVAIKR